METYLSQLGNGTLPEEIELFYTFEYTFTREEQEYGSASGFTTQ